jgi:hypothetical protein
VHWSEQGGFVHVNRQVSPSLHAQLNPHSPVFVAAPVSGFPLSGTGVVPEEPEEPEEPPSTPPLPMLKSYEQPTASTSPVTNARMQARRITLRA